MGVPRGGRGTRSQKHYISAYGAVRVRPRDARNRSQVADCWPVGKGGSCPAGATTSGRADSAAASNQGSRHHYHLRETPAKQLRRRHPRRFVADGDRPAAEHCAPRRGTDRGSSRAPTQSVRGERLARLGRLVRLHGEQQWHRQVRRRPRPDAATSRCRQLARCTWS